MKMIKAQRGIQIIGVSGSLSLLLLVLHPSVSPGETYSFSNFSGLALVNQGTNETDVAGSFSSGGFSVEVSGRIMEIPTSGTYGGKMKFRGEHGTNNNDWLTLKFNKPVESITFDFPSQDWIWSSTIQESVGVSTGSWTSFSNGVGAYDRNEVSGVETEFTPPAGTNTMGNGKIVVHNTDTQTLPRPYFTTRTATNRFVRPYNINRTAIIATATFAAPVTEVTLYVDDTHSSGSPGTIYLGGIDVTEAVPEPETYALVAGVLAFAVILLRRRSCRGN